MPEKISIVKESGETVSSNIVSVFTIPDTEKKYIITTENAVDPHGLTVLHVSEIVDGSLKKIATDEEWSSIKTIMRAIISGNVGSYKYLPAIEAIKAEGQYSRDISVSASASKQMIDNYNAADTSAVEEEETATSDGSIFPEGGSAPDEDNEVMPGISEVSEDAPAEEHAEAPTAEEAPALDEAPAAPVEAPALDDTPAAEEPTPEAPAETSAEEPAPAEPSLDEAIPDEPAPAEEPAEEPQPEMVTEDPSALTDDVQVPAIPAAPAPAEAAPAPEAASVPAAEPAPVPEPVVVPASDAPAPVEEAPAVSVAPEITPAATQEIATTATVAQPGPVVVPAQPEVQVLQPAQPVPTAQIAQGVPEVSVPPVQLDPNAVGSFKPDATLDEVVKGAQDMFMEGVKNLVQTIQEKVYRDLYIKEAEMKKREALVAQKEQMLNTQFATMMSNITANFNGVNMDPASVNANPVDPQQ